MTEILPLIKELAKDSIRERHWQEICDITGRTEIPYLTPDIMTLQHLLQANLLQYKEEVEDIADSADKQLKLEHQLKFEIMIFWEEAELEIKPYADILQPCTIAGNIDEIREKLEEHIMQLNQMLAMKYVAPFRGDVSEKYGLYSEVSEIIEKWLKVQSLWRNLVSVFTSGDISRQMPTEATIFKKIDK